MKYLTKYFIGFKNLNLNLKENENDQIHNVKHEKSKYQSEMEKCENLFDDILIDDIEKNQKKINLEFDDPKSYKDILIDLEEILKFENFINEKILDRSTSLGAVSRISSIDITKKNIHSEIDDVLINLNNDKEKKDMLDYDRYTQSFCEDLIDSFERHLEQIIQNSEIHNQYNQLKFNEFNDDRKDRFCRFCVIKKVNNNILLLLN